LVDSNLPPALVAWLRQHGYEADHVDDLLAPSAPDGAIWDMAMERRAIVITKIATSATARAAKPAFR
jgi:predicted nuclease of predicted toxin-antitoxin system